MLSEPSACHAVAMPEAAEPSPEPAAAESSEERARHTSLASDAAAPSVAASAERLAALLAGLDLASDDTADPAAPRPSNNDEALRREVPPHHL